VTESGPMPSLKSQMMGKSMSQEMLAPIKSAYSSFVTCFILLVAIDSNYGKNSSGTALLTKFMLLLTK
jgi:hypothetical protein